jgi:ABC-type oligopeptide transport system substrate-binding subunit
MPIPAPKGGTITLAAIGTFDNFNRYAARQPAVRTEALYDTLFTTSDDEPGSYYPLIAEHTRYADDFHGWRSRSTRAPAFMMARRSPPAMSRLPSTSL